jgi:ribulose-5-phosphate 4-epimerase/fuculose-1-phosphate aldolase
MKMSSSVPISRIMSQVRPEEWEARVTLAAGYRVLAYYGVDDMTYNHFSLRVPGEQDHMLIKSKNEMFSEVSASSLVKYHLDGHPVLPADAPNCTGGPLTIHAGLLRHRRDLNAVLHTHTPSMMGVAAQKSGLLPLSQQAMRFYGTLKYHDFGGLEFESRMTQMLLDDLDGGDCMLLHACFPVTLRVLQHREY